jgi:hypothetical protein
MPNWNAVVESLESRLLLTVTAEEQLFVYLLNRARANPVAYQQEANIPLSVVDLSTVTPRQPLAINTQLFASAQVHADDMAQNNYFEHLSPITNAWPNKLARDAGYPLPAGWENDANFIESIGAGHRGAAELLKEFIEDIKIEDAGHRVHLMGIGNFHSDNNEIGVGYAFNFVSQYRDYWAVHATYSNPSDQFLTGVVFADANSNGRYDLNEGLAGVSISAGAFQTTTNAAGGWAIKVPDGQYTVTASGGAFIGSSTFETTVNGQSVAVDFASNLPGGWVNFSRVGAQRPSIVVNSQSVVEGDSGTKQMNFTVSLAAASPEAWTVSYTTSDATAQAGVDYIGRSGTLTFLPGETSKAVSDIIGDMQIEEDETFNIIVTGPANAMQATGTILNDDIPRPLVFIGNAEVAEGQAGVSALTFEVVLSKPGEQTITVDYATADGTAVAGLDYAPQASTLTFAPGETSKTITIMVLGDAVYEANETLLVNLTGAANATIVTAQGVGTIINDDVLIAPSVLMAVGAKKRTILANAQRKAVSFGKVAVGSRPPVQKFWIYNTGNAKLSVGRIRLPRGFALASVQPKAVAPGRAATFLVRMTTTAAKKWSGQITFGTTDPGNRTYRIPIAGTVGGKVKAKKVVARQVAASPIEQRRAEYAGLFSSSAVEFSAAAGLVD